ncbi:MAG: hypothetical protein WKG07_42115 [Hymenobacter sp.]
MANRNKPLSAQALTKDRAVAALTRHLFWQKWPLARQLDYLFAPGAAEEMAANLESHTALAQLHLHCVAHKTVAERAHTRALLQALAIGLLGAATPARRSPRAGGAGRKLPLPGARAGRLAAQNQKRPRAARKPGAPPLRPVWRRAGLAHRGLDGCPHR